MPPAPGQDEPINRMVKIVNSFLAREDVAPFSEPVDWRGMELYDYPEVIEKMMDLGTIKRRLERGQYNTAHEVGEDIRLVFNNCMTYNADGSDFWLLAKGYLRRFEDRYRKVRNEFDVGEDYGDDEDGDEPDTKSAATAVSGSRSRASTSGGTGGGGGGRDSIMSTVEASTPSNNTMHTAPLDVRARFGANLFLLSGIELGIIISDLESSCPHVLESWGGTDSSKIEINVDEIPLKIFTRLQKYVHGLVESGGSSNGSGMGSEIQQEDPTVTTPKKKKRKSS